VYAVDSRYLSNPRSERLLETQSPRLSQAQQDVVDQLKTRGIALMPFHELFAERASSFWPSFEHTARTFAGSERVRDEAQRYQKGADAAAWKEYVIKHLQPNQRVAPDDPVMSIGLRPEILDTVNSYLGLWSILSQFNIWYTIPVDDQRARSASQRWHRDPEDRHIVKVFLYVNEVDRAAGPLEYIPGSREGGPYAHLWPMATGGGFPDGSYPPQQNVEGTVPQDARVVCTCPPATLVFCDTSGFHRGGYASKERLLGIWAFVTPASRHKAEFSVLPGTVSAGGSVAAEHAISRWRRR
jgi:hypothetical protein